jgi:hypothetical protein
MIGTITCAISLVCKEPPWRRNIIIECPLNERIHHHPAECYEESLPESISDTDNWCTWNRHLDIPNDSGDHSEVYNAAVTQLDKGIEDSEAQDERHISTALNDL